MSVCIYLFEVESPTSTLSLKCVHEQQFGVFFWNTKAKSKGCYKRRRAECGAEPENQWSVTLPSLQHDRWDKRGQSRTTLYSSKRSLVEWIGCMRGEKWRNETFHWNMANIFIKFASADEWENELGRSVFLTLAVEPCSQPLECRVYPHTVQPAGESMWWRGSIWRSDGEIWAIKKTNVREAKQELPVYTVSNQKNVNHKWPKNSAHAVTLFWKCL